MAEFVSAGYCVARRRERGVLSASSCLCSFYSDAWDTVAFSDKFGWPHIYYRLADALKATTDDAVVFGLGLHERFIDEFLVAARLPDGETGIFECVKQRAAVDPGGVAAGFELSAVDIGLITCSWLCNGLEKDCAERFGVGLNADGLIANYDDALRCLGYVRGGEVQPEPGLWLPWLLTVYS